MRIALALNHLRNKDASNRKARPGIGSVGWRFYSSARASANGALEWTYLEVM
jgi:hypothetical protein